MRTRINQFREKSDRRWAEQLEAMGGEHHKQVLDETFGELKVIARMPSRRFGRSQKLISVWKLSCAFNHLEIRSWASLAVTGQSTKCKQCRKEATNERSATAQLDRRR